MILKSLAIEFEPVDIAGPGMYYVHVQHVSESHIVLIHNRHGQPEGRHARQGQEEGGPETRPTAPDIQRGQVLRGT